MKLLSVACTAQERIQRRRRRRCVYVYVCKRERERKRSSSLKGIVSTTFETPPQM